MFRYIVLISFFELFHFSGSSQSGWKIRQLIYNDANIKVELQYNDIKNGCINSNEPIQFRYRLNGFVVREEKYVTWKMDYIDCSGNLYEDTKSIQIGGIDMVQVYGTNKLTDINVYDPTNSNIYATNFTNNYYDVTTSPINKNSHKIKTNIYSITPTGIDGIANLLYGETTKLTVVGGVLGLGAEWIWYKNICGQNRIGSGKSIETQASENAKYFVRAEGNNNNTPCVEISISVDQSSRSATKIVGDLNVCNGESTTLSVDGGHLGKLADWYWYTGLKLTTIIGKGKSIMVKPLSETTYYVRAEGSTNKTAPISITVSVWEKPIQSDSIKCSGSKTICEGEKRLLSVIGGFLSEDAEWRWYERDCGVNMIGSGNTISVSPTKTTNYYVRAEGKCYKTLCRSLTIKVNQVSRRPDYISTPSIIYKNKEIILKLEGGFLAPNSTWVWSKGICSSKNTLVSGSQLNIKLRKPTTIFVKATGPCFETECTSLRLEPIRYHSPYKYSYINSFGIDLGFEYQQFYGPGFTTINYNSTVTTEPQHFTISGFGLGIKLLYYPIINQDFVFHISPSYTYGTGIKSASYDYSANTDENNYEYHNIMLESEISYGFPVLKFLSKYQINSQINDYIKTTYYGNAVSTNIYNSYNNRQSLFFGFKIGRLLSKYSSKRCHTLDLSFSMSKVLYSPSFLVFKDGVINKQHWYKGIQIIWNLPQRINIKFDSIFDSKKMMSDESDLLKPMFNAAINFRLQKL